ncbi:MAG: class I SAM-dependent methyltransferase [Actinobacteria bacterium]|nr:class I SAM-dependent methyltransferase [Actinomycetota bacterium]
MSTFLGQLYEAHHRQRRNAGDFVFVPERIPLFQEAIGQGRHVLDLGCRSGALTRHFLDGNDVVGVDVDRAALAKAEQLGITPVVADVDEPLPAASETFDAVVAGELLEHVRFPRALVAEVRRVLRPGGVFVGSVPNAFRVQNRLRFVRGLQPERDPTHLHMFTPGDIRALLANFTGVRTAVIGGRYRRLHARLLAQDIVFSATRL